MTSMMSKQMWADPNHRVKMRTIMMGKTHSLETRSKMSVAAKKLFQDPVYRKRLSAAWNMKPNQPEILLLWLLEGLYSGDWQYMGDFSFIVNGKNPDFMHVKQKKLIEFFGDYWHRNDCPGVRAAIFAACGYQTLVIWECEMKDLERVADRIHEFALKGDQ